MVLESLMDSFKAVKKPSHLVLYGFLVSVIALFLAYWVFPQFASIIYVFFIVMAVLPLMFNIIKSEEKKDISDFHEVILLKEHSKALLAFMALFLGITLAVTLVYVLVPSNAVSTMFSSQTSTINTINARVTGLVTGNVTGFPAFTRIFLNNVKVLIFCVLFSFLYGAGAIFILSWNASVIGVAMGNYIRSNIAAIAAKEGMNHLASYFTVVGIGLLKYVIHGIPEILAYFVAALAGGIISIGVIRHDFKGRKFEKIVLDSADLLLLSLVIIFIAAILEVWVTPFVFG